MPWCLFTVVEQWLWQCSIFLFSWCLPVFFLKAICSSYFFNWPLWLSIIFQIKSHILTVALADLPDSVLHTPQFHLLQFFLPTLLPSLCPLLALWILCEWSPLLLSILVRACSLVFMFQAKYCLLRKVFLKHIFLSHYTWAPLNHITMYFAYLFTFYYLHIFSLNIMTHFFLNYDSGGW